VTLKRTLSAVALAGLGIALLTILLVYGFLPASIYGVLFVVVALISMAVASLPRLQILDLKNLRITLNELERATKEARAVKREMEEMYGEIENLRKTPIVLDDTKIENLGLKPETFLMGRAVVQYIAGCVTRERERLARIARAKCTEKLAEG